MYKPGLVAAASFEHRKIVSIAAGVFFSIAITEDGVLYSWGNTLNGAPRYSVGNGHLGLGNLESANTPQRVGGSDVFGRGCVWQAACGKRHMLVLTHDNRIWSVGSNADGQLGQDQMTTCVVPHPVDMRHFSDEKVVLVAAGISHSAAVTKCGRMYIWGMTTIFEETLVWQPRYHMGGDYVGEQRGGTLLPSAVLMYLFRGARLGRWYGLSRAHILALAMGLHERLGPNSPLASYTDDFLAKIASINGVEGGDVNIVPDFEALGIGLRTY